MSEQAMTGGRSRDHLLIGVVAGTLVVASLGATAGWFLRGTPSGAEPTAQVAQADAAPLVASAETGQAPPPAPNRAPATQKPAPVLSQPAPAAAPREPVQTQPVAVCTGCGTVEGVRAVQVKGEGSGVGAVAGGVLGAVVGNQMGAGNGRKALTVLGAVGGGFAGNEVEKRARGETVYEVRVRLDDGGTRTITQKTAPAPGSRVVVEGTHLRAISAAEEAPRTYRTGT